MAESTQSVDENIKIQFHQLQSMNNQLAVVKEFKKSVSAEMKNVTHSIGSLGKSLSKSFSLKSLGSKISDTFNKGLKHLSTPFKSLGSKLSSAFSGLKAKISNFKPIQAIKDKFSNITKKPINTVKTLLGKNDEQLKKKFFRLWSNPKKVAKIWNKEASNTKNMSKGAAKKSADISEVGGALLGVVAKFFTMLNKFITKVLLKLVAAFHAAIGPYVLLIVGTIILLALLFKDQIKELIPVFGKILNVVADVLDSVKGPLGELLVRIVSLVTSIYEAIGNVLAAALNGVAAILTGLVSLVTHIVSTVDTVWNLLSDVLITLLTPIRDVVVALQPVFEGMVNLLKRFIDNPVGTAVDVGKSIVGGMKSLVGGLFGSDTKDEEEGGSILDKIFTSIGDALLEVKEFVVGGGLKEVLLSAFDTVSTTLVGIFDSVKEQLRTAFDYVVEKINGMNIFTSLRNFVEKVIPDFHLEIFKRFEKLTEDLQSINMTLTASIMSSASSMFTGLSIAASNIKNKVKGIFGIEPSEEEKKAAERPKNPFMEFIKGFEQMRTDSIKLLTEIKTAVLNIEKNKIEIGGLLSQNNGQTSDGKSANNIQNITLNYQVDINRILDKMDETNQRLDGILTNTSINESGEQKVGAVWSI